MNDVAISPVKNLSNFLEKNKAQIAAALPKHLSPDRMCRLALTAFSQNRKLAECELNTIFASVVIASQLGLEIGIAGQGFLVPYKGRCTFIPGWQGLVDLVSRSGRAAVWTGAVFDGDEFDWAMGDRPYIKHKPKGEDDIKKLTHTYAVGRAKGSDWPIIEVWAQDRLVSHRDKYNKVGEDHYSFKNWEMYARKIPLLQVIKYLPKSIELANAIALEGAYAEGKTAILDGDFVRVDGGEEPEAPVEQPEIRKNAAGGQTSESVSGTSGKDAAAATKKGAPTIEDCKALLNEQGKDALETLLDWKRHLPAADQVELEKLLEPIQKAMSKPDKPIQDGQKRIVMANIKRSQYTLKDLEEKFGKVGELPQSKLAEVNEWLASKPL
jgi:recombination protein RecT